MTGVKELLENLAPCPFPMLPIPRGAIRSLEGLRPYTIGVLEGNVIREIGTAWARDQEEAEEAGEHMVIGNGYSAIVAIERDGE